MRTIARALVVATLAFIGAMLLGLSSTMSSSVQLLASYALKGSQVPVLNIESDQDIQRKAIRYGVINDDGSPPTVVQYPADGSVPTDQAVATGVANLQAATAGDDDPVIFGYSLGALVASEYKRARIQNPGTGTPTYVLIGNPSRPNGGLFSRNPGLGGAFPPTPTGPVDTPDAEPTTTDIAGQYDNVADQPTNPLNPFSAVNSVLGSYYVHLNYQNLRPEDKILQDRYGDTEYYLIPTYPVPLLMPVQAVPVLGPLVADMLDPAVRVLVETGYDRTISPGQPTPADSTYFPDPIALGGNLITATATGLDNGLQKLSLGRPLGTTRPDIGPGSTGTGAYGIGGPPVTLPDDSTTAGVRAAQQTTPTDHQSSTDTAPRAAPRLNVVRHSPAATMSPQSRTRPLRPLRQKHPGPQKSVLAGVTKSITTKLRGPSTGRDTADKGDKGDKSGTGGSDD